ncbi:hypothetical protein SAMN05421776_12163 [Nocardia farcinica]|uniref:Uncharacterized protein n=1 Tax=Nocardia farcinica TaxID=37329 RepID=A0A0H5P8N7_NOCFR|nr:hypothetical protein [Nocardia farcinica]AXK88540.1 hypothetical protein DXT66_25610 [Nocardia farcinica]PFW98841.1 hypothetical protein CJ469_05802 [Nocardia farcinica]PFX04447.1 hypothetical protein CJ468_05423 [Nocardia farcinica]CRY84200.1 Uncharacterised protein [Nocardia farcinica]SIT34123.1 hypothetical protein SAMN05421776_12163 [Nocardia farcinica]
MTATLTAVIWEDRHTDTTAHLFSDFADAVAWAWEQAWQIEGRRDRPLIETRQYPSGEVRISYGAEGDGLWIRTAIVDDELTKHRE